jgi:hypothetical protein
MPKISQSHRLPNPGSMIRLRHDYGIVNSAKQTLYTVIGVGEPVFNITFR